MSESFNQAFQWDKEDPFTDTSMRGALPVGVTKEDATLRRGEFPRASEEILHRLSKATSKESASGVQPPQPLPSTSYSPPGAAAYTRHLKTVAKSRTNTTPTLHVNTNIDGSSSCGQKANPCELTPPTTARTGFDHSSPAWISGHLTWTTSALLAAANPVHGKATFSPPPSPRQSGVYRAQIARKSLAELELRDILTRDAQRYGDSSILVPASASRASSIRASRMHSTELPALVARALSQPPSRDRRKQREDPIEPAHRAAGQYGVREQPRAKTWDIAGLDKGSGERSQRLRSPCNTPCEQRASKQPAFSCSQAFFSNRPRQTAAGQKKPQRPALGRASTTPADFDGRGGTIRTVSGHTLTRSAIRPGFSRDRFDSDASSESDRADIGTGATWTDSHSPSTLFDSFDSSSRLNSASTYQASNTSAIESSSKSKTKGKGSPTSIPSLGALYCYFVHRQPYLNEELNPSKRSQQLLRDIKILRWEGLSVRETFKELPKRGHHDVGFWDVLSAWRSLDDATFSSQTKQSGGKEADEDRCHERSEEKVIGHRAWSQWLKRLKFKKWTGTDTVEGATSHTNAQDYPGPRTLSDSYTSFLRTSTEGSLPSSFQRALIDDIYEDDSQEIRRLHLDHVNNMLIERLEQSVPEPMDALTPNNRKEQCDQSPPSRTSSSVRKGKKRAHACAPYAIEGLPKRLSSPEIPSRPGLKRNESSLALMQITQTEQLTEPSRGRSARKPPPWPLGGSIPHPPNKTRDPSKSRHHFRSNPCSTIPPIYNQKKRPKRPTASVSHPLRSNPPDAPNASDYQEPTTAPHDAHNTAETSNATSRPDARRRILAAAMEKSQLRRESWSDTEELVARAFAKDLVDGDALEMAVRKVSDRLDRQEREGGEEGRTESKGKGVQGFVEGVGHLAEGVLAELGEEEGLALESCVSRWSCSSGGSTVVDGAEREAGSF